MSPGGPTQLEACRRKWSLVSYINISQQQNILCGGFNNNILCGGFLLSEMGFHILSICSGRRHHITASLEIQWASKSYIECL